MKVVIATGIYPPEIGGPATHVRVLEEYLKKPEFDLETVTYGSVRSMLPGVRFFAYLFALVRAARGAHLIYALDPVTVGLPALIVAKLFRLPFVLRLGGDYAWEVAEQRYGNDDPLVVFNAHMERYPLSVRTLSFLERFVARSADRVLVPSEHLGRVLLSWGVKKDRLAVLYSVFEPRSITEGREAIREMFAYRGLVLFSAGRLVSWKGFKTLIELVPELKEELETDVTLIIAGDGPEMPALSARVKELGLEESVRLIGNQPQDTLLTAIKGADIFVLNAAYSGFAHQLLEVMHLGIPVITTEVGVNPELMTPDVEGVLVPYDDRAALKSAILKLATHPKERERLGQAAQERVKAFTVEHMTDALIPAFLAYAPEEKRKD